MLVSTVILEAVSSTHKLVSWVVILIAYLGSSARDFYCPHVNLSMELAETFHEPKTLTNKSRNT